MDIKTIIFLTLAPLLWSLNFLIGKAVVGIIPASALNLSRWIIAFLLVYPFVHKELILYKKTYLKNWPLLIFLSLTGYCLNSLTAYQSVHYTTAINASFIASFNPVAFALTAFFLSRELITLLQGIGIILSMLGVSLLIFKGNPSYILQMHLNMGDLLMLLGVLSFSIHSVLLKKKDNIFPKNSLLAALILGGIFTAIPFFIWENIYAGWNWIFQLSGIHYLSLLALGIFPSFFAYYCWNKALSIAKPNQASIFLNLIPVFTTIMSIIIFQENLGYYHILGGLLIMLGVILVTNYQQIRSFIKKISPYL